jgi:endonuclease-3
MDSTAKTDKHQSQNQGQDQTIGNDEAAEIIRLLDAAYPGAACGLEFDTPFHLLVATVLSAQCTDTRVNKVTPALFAAAPTPEAFLALGEEAVRALVATCGLANTKAKNIIGLCQILVNDYGSEVPRTMEQLTGLPGVGRKTANVVLSNAFGVDAIAVDTHVFRVSNRIGLARASNVLSTEKMLMASIPKALWSGAHHLLITHGRQRCHARKPDCDGCPVLGHCRFRRQAPENKEAE